MSLFSKYRALPAAACGVLALAIPLTLGGCSVGTPTISSQDFAKQVTGLLEKTVGKTPTVTCGSDPIPVVNGGVVHCDVSDPADPATIYDSTTTISNVNGGDFHIDTKVADHAK